jgi:hypothetical protein
MMDINTRVRWIIFGLMIVMVLAAGGCASGEPERLWLKTPSWSRAIHLGETRTVAPPPAVVSEDGKVHTVLFDLLDPENPEENRERVYPWWITLGEDGRIENRVRLDVQIGTPEISRLVRDAGRYKLLWIDSYQLYLLEFDQHGQIVSEIIRLSTEDRIESFDFSRNAAGNLVIWYAGNRQKPGIYQLEFTGSGIEKKTIDREGVRVHLIRDQAGDLHATWARYPWGYGTLGWYYGYVPQGDVNRGEVQQIFSRGVSNAVRIEGPVIGLDQDLVYVYWSETIVSGLDAGNRTTFYQTFPLGEPDQATEPQRISVSRTDKIEPNDQPEGGLDTGPRISLEPGTYPATEALSSLNALAGQFAETAVSFRVETEYMWRESKNQVNIAYLQEGQPTSYQPLSFTSTVSYEPKLTGDDQGNLYLLWLEKREISNSVYLATTDPGKMDYLNQVTREDYLSLGAEMGFGILAGIVLSPFAAAVWGGLSLIALTINSLFKNFRSAKLRSLGQLLSLLGALFIFWWLKFATLPGIDEGYTPFSAWIPRMPVRLEQPLQIGVPVLIGLLGLFLAWFFTYRKGTRSPIYFMLIYAGVDAFLTTAVYGILIYGSF